MASTGLVRLPKWVTFRPDVWNSQPVDENFPATLAAKKFYRLDEAECRLTLLNTFGLIHRFGILDTSFREPICNFLSSLLCLLAANIRSLPDVTPLIDAHACPESLADTETRGGWEKPISPRNQLSIELRNAVCNVEHFDIVAPALAWAMVGHFAYGDDNDDDKKKDEEAGDDDGFLPPRDASRPSMTSSSSSFLEQAMRAECERWRRLGVEVAMPRGCLKFIEKRLPELARFRFDRRDVLTLVKSTALFVKNSNSSGANCNSSSSSSRDSPASGGSNTGMVANLMLQRQLERFTQPLLEERLGPLAVLDEISQGRPELVRVLLDCFDSVDVSVSPDISRSLKSLRCVPFIESAEDARGPPHRLRSPQLGAGATMAYMRYCVFDSDMLCYLSAKLPHNQRMIRCLQTIRDRLREDRARPQSPGSCGGGTTVTAAAAAAAAASSSSSQTKSDSENDTAIANRVADLYRRKVESLRDEGAALAATETAGNSVTTATEVNCEEGFLREDFWEDGKLASTTTTTGDKKPSKKRRNRKKNAKGAH